MDRVNKYIRFCLKNMPICIVAIGFNAVSGWFRSLGASFLERITDAIEVGITDGLIGLIFLGALLQGSSYILRWLGAITSEYLSAKIGFTLRLELYDKLTHIAYPWYENEQQGNLVSVIRRDTVQAGEAIYAVLSRIISNLFLLVFSVIVMAKTDAVMTALTLAAVCLITWMNQRFLKYISLWTKKAQRTIGQATDTLEKVFSGLETVKAHGAEDFAAGRYLDHIRNYCRYEKKVVSLDIVRDTLLNLVTKCLIYVPLIVLGMAAIRGGRSLGSVAVFVYLAREILTPIAVIFRWTANIARYTPSYDRADEILSLPDQENPPADIRKLSEVKECRVEGLSYKYGEGRPVFDNVSFVLKQRQIARLAGESGSGKTTMMKVLLGLYPCPTARYLMDGTIISTLQSNITYACLDQAVFSMSVYDNLSMGDPAIDKESCVRLIEQMGFGEWLRGLEKGIDTQIKPDSLSGGQKQMISTCRALLQETPILLLDEPFSALDTEKRKRLWEELQRRKEKQLILIISHAEAEEDDEDKIAFDQEIELKPRKVSVG